MSEGQNALITAVAANWPTLAAAGVASFMLFSWLSGNGFIDSVVHKSAFDQMVIQNAHDHKALSGAIGEIKDDVKTMLREQSEQGRRIERIDAVKNK